MGGCTARLFAQNFDAVLVGIVIYAEDAIFAKFYQMCPKPLKLHILRYRTCRFFRDTHFFEVWLRQRRARARAWPGTGAPHGPMPMLGLGGGGGMSHTDVGV